MRVKHWCKNLLILFPLIFSGNLMDRDSTALSLLGVFHFCMVSSIVYIVNDTRDCDKDNRHPLKHDRPIASGEVSTKEAWKVGAVLAILWLGGIYAIFLLKGRAGVELFSAAYLLVNLAYSFGLKEVPIIDVTMIAVGYLIRLYFGGWLIGTGISDWMFLTVLSAAYYLGFGKRKKELTQYGGEYRGVLRKYSAAFLDKSTDLFMGLTLVFYSLSCVSESTTAARLGVKLSWSVPIVILIALRYNMLLESCVSTGDPTEMIMGDRLLGGMALLYGTSILVILYWR